MELKDILMDGYTTIGCVLALEFAREVYTVGTENIIKYVIRYFTLSESVGSHEGDYNL